MFHCIFHVFQAIDIQESFLLTGKRSVRQVFGSSRRAHGHRDLVGTGIGHHFSPRFGNFIIQLLGERGIQNPLADFFANTRQLNHIVNIQRAQCGRNAFAQAVVGEKSAISVSCGGKAARNAYTLLRQLTDHLTERSIFPPTLSTSVMRRFSNQIT